MADWCLVVEQLRKSFARREVLRSLSFQLQPGEIVGFVGPNGAGKTTTMKIITGLIKPQAGDVRLGPYRLRERPREFLAQVGVLIDSPGIYPSLKAYDHLAYLARARGCFSRELIVRTLDTVGLSSTSHKPVRQFSLGMKQRLAIAMAIVHSPQLLILDEPMNGLDPAGMVMLRGFLRSLAADRGVSVFISSHLLAEVEKMCDRVLFIRDGRLLANNGAVQAEGGTRALFWLRTDDDQRVHQLLLQQDFVTEATALAGGGIECRLPVACAPRLAALLVNSGIGIYEMARRRESLENLYLTQYGAGAAGGIE